MSLGRIPITLSLSLCAIAFGVSPRGCANPQLQAYAGRWLLKSHGKNMMLLTIRAHGDTLSGTWVGPKKVGEDSAGEFTGIFLPIITRPLTGQAKGDAVEIVLGPKSDEDRVTMKLRDKSHLQVAFFRGAVPDWTFERVTGRQPVQVSSDWPAHSNDPKIAAIQEQLEAMAREDQAAREKTSIDPQETTALAEQDRPFLESIFKQYGWPKISVFDVTPCNDFWLLVQHQPPDVEEEMLPALQKAVSDGEASRTNYAYLFDRVQTDEGKPQHWGTQAKCENGQAILYPVDDMKGIDERRKAIGLAPLTAYIQSLAALCKRVPN